MQFFHVPGMGGFGFIVDIIALLFLKPEHAQINPLIVI